ncbi:hypothetical protein NVS47_09645 [Dehalobacterium formicoaceticum]|uniref:YhhN-like protein n=1 Tax=Dehalobacterium formicoaceticum TaxID=51515 RepID=A0ABT1Y788_9FIRM|nr:hypothetical protein [Dehalobacterium formicoaceticum]MCR6545769.1 hypothetical protein [Dehalobacterium formicoaceticum]
MNMIWKKARETAMSKKKKFFISFLIMLMILICVFCIILDFYRFSSLPHDQELFSSYLIKRMIVLLSVVIVFAAGKDSYHPKDYQKMKIIFLVIGLGETAFLLENTISAVLLFFICHFLLILRNGKGLKNKLINADARVKTKLRLSALCIGIISIVLITLFYTCLPLKSNSLPVISYIYLIILSISFWVGLAAYLLNLFPLINAQMIAVGTACFYCCDLLVGIDIFIHSSYAGLLISSAVWVFYTPALLFLALSCYKFTKFC